MAYSLQTTLDTWLKTSTAQGSALADNQRQFLEAGTMLPLTSFALAGADHIKLTLGKDQQGRQIQYRGRNTWYIYQPAVRILRDGQVVNLTQLNSPQPNSPSSTAYSLKTTLDTWLKVNTAQGSALADSQRQFLEAGTVLPLSAFSLVENDHISLTLGKDQQGRQIQYKGRNTWYIYRPAVQILRDGQVIDLSQASSTRKINAKGLRLLKSFEGLRLDAYLDAVGVWTIGYGTTTGVRPGMRITEAQAEQFLMQDLARFEDAVSSLVKVLLNDDQFSALVSFTYNVGEGALAGSTLLRLLNQVDYSGAADQFLRWNRGDGAVLAGLTRRRRAERALFLGQDYTVYL